MIGVHEVVGPAFLASALVNNDLSGIDNPEDLACYHAFLDRVKPWVIVDIKRGRHGEAEEPWFSWSFGLYGGNARGGDVVTYICHEVRP